MKRPIISALLLAASLAGLAQAAPYRVSLPLSDDHNGALVYLTNYDTGERLDSVTVRRGVATFSGEIDEAIPASVVVDGRRAAVFVLEPGSIGINAKERYAFGSMLNDIMRQYSQQADSLYERYQAAPDAEAAQAIEAEYDALSSNVVAENSDNPIGYLYFCDQASMMDAKTMHEALDKYPSLKGYKRVQRMLQSAERREATQPGGKMIDFEITYDGQTKKLSDYVGKGDYVIVDFWASWCGPCTRQGEVLKEIYAKYADKGLKILGVAVWDEPEATLRAIEKHAYPWDMIINAQSIPTDLYGISGIPTIILFGPDGTILSRDKQDNELRADVDKFFGSTLK